MHQQISFSVLVLLIVSADFKIKKLTYLKSENRGGISLNCSVLKQGLKLYTRGCEKLLCNLLWICAEFLSIII